MRVCSSWARLEAALAWCAVLTLQRSHQRSRFLANQQPQASQRTGRLNLPQLRKPSKGQSGRLCLRAELLSSPGSRSTCIEHVLVHLFRAARALRLVILRSRGFTRHTDYSNIVANGGVLCVLQSCEEWKPTTVLSKACLKRIPGRPGDQPEARALVKRVSEVMCPMAECDCGRSLVP